MNRVQQWIARVAGIPAGETARETAGEQRAGGIDVVLQAWHENRANEEMAVTPDSAIRVSAVWACVRVLAESIASLPLFTYERQERGKRRATEHYLYRLLHDQVNPYMTAFQFREVMQASLALWGNAYARRYYDSRGRVEELWPLRPDRMLGKYLIEGRIWYHYQEDTGGMTPNLRETWLSEDDVWQIPGLGGDGQDGYSPIALMRRSIGLANSAEKFGAKFFENDARPGIILEHPGVLGEAAYKNLLESWESQHLGVDKSHKPAILEEGMKLHEVGIPPEDAQFLETRKFQVNEIARIFRVPPHMIADLDRATFSNIEHMSLEFVMHTLRPWLVRWEQSIQTNLLLEADRERYYTEFLVDGLLRGDIASRYQAYAVGRQNGWLSANDIRAMENMDAIDGGDVYLVPLNMIPADQLGNLGVPEPASDSEEGEPNPDQARAFRSKQSEQRQAGPHTSTMIALRLPQDAADALILPDEVLPEGSEPTPSDQMHMTLVFLGNLDSDEQRSLILAVMRQFALDHGPVSGMVSGVGRFLGAEAGMDALYLSFDALKLARFRTELVDALATVGIKSPSEHGFTPHITLAYLPTGTSAPDVKPAVREINFRSIEVYFGEEVTSFDLTGPTERSQSSPAEHVREERSLRSARSRQRIALAQQQIFRDVAERALRRETNDVREAARKYLGKRDQGQFLIWMDEFYRGHADWMIRQYLPVMLAYGNMVAGEIDDELGAAVPDGSGITERFVRSYTGSFAAQQVGISQYRLRERMAQAGREGQDLGEAVGQELDAWQETRPDEITQEQPIRAGNALAQTLYLAAGVQKLRWVTLDSNPYCQTLNGVAIPTTKFFVPAGESITVEGAGTLSVTKNIGHPPLVAGCSCMITAG